MKRYGHDQNDQKEKEMLEDDRQIIKKQLFDKIRFQE
jgi:hypothetical protein